MNKPQVHTFGLAKYVYASAYDQIEADNAKLRETLRDVTELTNRLISKVRRFKEGGGA